MWRTVRRAALPAVAARRGARLRCASFHSLPFFEATDRAMAIWLVPTLVSLFLYGIGQGLVKKYISEVPPARFCLYFVAAKAILNMSYYALFQRAELFSPAAARFDAFCLVAYLLDGLGWLLYF